MKYYILPVAAALVMAACTPNDKPQATQVIVPESASSSGAAASLPEAVETGSAALAEKNIRAAIADAAPDIAVDKIRPSVFPGVYEVRVKGYGPAYVSADGKYMIQGELFRLDGKNMINETEASLAVERKQALSEIPMKEMIVFPAKGERKGLAYVFTDIDCGYCRKLHAEMTDFNQAGIEIRYLAFPRAGYPSPSASKLDAVWCSADPLKAMTMSKQGQPVTSPACQSPVKKQFELGGHLGVRGTPAVFLESGEQVGGYLPAAALTKMLGIK
jgi:thiol:disulfide interchange protein DsbC